MMHRLVERYWNQFNQDKTWTTNFKECPVEARIHAFFDDNDDFVLIPAFKGQFYPELVVVVPQITGYLGLKEAKDLFESFPPEFQSNRKIDAIKELRQIGGNACKAFKPVETELAKVKIENKELKERVGNLIEDVNRWKGNYDNVVNSLLSPSNIQVWQFERWVEIKLNLEGEDGIVFKDSIKVIITAVYDLSKNISRPFRAQIKTEGGEKFMPMESSELRALPAAWELGDTIKAERLI